MSGLLDRNFLTEIGITVGDTEYQALSETYEKVLSDRVVASIIQGLSEPQLEQLHEYQTKGDEELQRWLTANVTDLKEIIENEIEILLEEIIENSEEI